MALMQWYIRSIARSFIIIPVLYQVAQRAYPSDPFIDAGKLSTRPKKTLSVASYWKPSRTHIPEAIDVDNCDFGLTKTRTWHSEEKILLYIKRLNLWKAINGFILTAKADVTLQVRRIVIKLLRMLIDIIINCHHYFMQE